MSDIGKLIRDTAKAIRPHVEQQLDLRDIFADYRKAITNAGGDWMALKNLVKAQIEDERDEDGEGQHVAKIIERADFASAYADILGLNENNSFAANETEASGNERTRNEERSAREQGNPGGGDHAHQRRLHEAAGERPEQAGNRGPDQSAASALGAGRHHNGAGRSAAPQGLVLPVNDQSDGAGFPAEPDAHGVARSAADTRPERNSPQDREAVAPVSTSQVPSAPAERAAEKVPALHSKSEGHSNPQVDIDRRETETGGPRPPTDGWAPAEESSEAYVRRMRDEWPDRQDHNEGGTPAKAAEHDEVRKLDAPETEAAIGSGIGPGPVAVDADSADELEIPGFLVRAA